MIDRRRARPAIVAALVTAAVAAGCGKKGPPLPPLILLPTPPADFALVRHDGRVDLTFKVPGANTDRSTPADLARMEVYALTAPEPVSADEVVRRGTVVASMAVNKPKDPDEPEPEKPAPKGPGLDQDEVATTHEDLPADRVAAEYRAYVVVGVNTHGRRGALSPRIAVPLVDAPPAPSQPAITYTEKAITVSWDAVASVGDQAAYQYSVYTPGQVAPLTAGPARDPLFVDNAVEWEKERCYEVRSVAVVNSVRVESAASPSQCVTPHDTFPPAAPAGLVGVGSQGAISLIWTANSEADLAGYIVLRAIEPSTDLTPVTEAPIPDTNFRDTVPAGSRATYAVVAVDKVGNRSEPSNRIAETAR